MARRLTRRTDCFLAIAVVIVLYGSLANSFVAVVQADDIRPANAPAQPVPVGNKAPAADNFADKVDVHVDGKTMRLGAAIRQKAADPQQSLYRKLRATNGGTIDGQLSLALWCRKQKLADEERLHWWILLSMQPGNPEAIKALRLRNFQGMLLTSKEIEQFKQKQKRIEEAARKWGPKVKKLKQSIEQGDATEREAALRELKAIQDPLALPSVEEIFAVDAHITLQLVDMLAKMPAGEAGESLARLAVHSKDQYVREQAAAALQLRPYATYVPVLIAGLAAPVELSFDVSVDPGGTTFKHVEWQEYDGRLAVGLWNKVRLSGNYTTSDVMFWIPTTTTKSGIMATGYRPDRIRYNYRLTRDGADGETQHEYAGTIEGQSGLSKNRRKAESIEGLDKKVRAANEAQALINQRIHAALSKATGVAVVPGQPDAANQNADVNPKLWWEWWKKQSQPNNYLARGTEVWTQTGPEPIEQILVGDRVLTRDAKSGELSFCLVVGSDEQTQSAMRVLEVDSRTIVVTPEQRFFVAGAGWRKASELQAGMKLHSLAGPRPIERVAAADGIAKFALVVADVSNFFVDRQGILVHDATHP